VDHTGGALICREDPALNRITKYIPQLPDSVFKGETLYLRLCWSDGYRVFSPFWVSTLDSYDLYECHVGPGYTRIVSEFYGVRTEVTIFVPLGESREIRDMRIANVSDCPLAIDAIPVVEYTHPDALKQFTNADWVPQTMQSRAHPDEKGLVVLIQYPFMTRDTRINYFTSNCPVASLESDRKKFLRDSEGGTWPNPYGLRRGELSNSESLRGDNIAALLHHLGVLQPGETVRLITQLGQAAGIGEAMPGIRPVYDGLQISPCIPSGWEGFKAVRRFRDAVYAIEVRNPDHICRGASHFGWMASRLSATLCPPMAMARYTRWNC
jgi:cellobiose phosphorylase